MLLAFCGGQCGGGGDRRTGLARCRLSASAPEPAAAWTAGCRTSSARVSASGGGDAGACRVRACAGTVLPPREIVVRSYLRNKGFSIPFSSFNRTHPSSRFLKDSACTEHRFPICIVFVTPPYTPNPSKSAYLSEYLLLQRTYLIYTT